MRNILSRLIPSFSIGILLFFTILSTSCEPKDDCDENPPPENCDSCNMVYKPNVYIYPEEQIELSLTLDFPQGGEVVVSIPEYGSGWNVSVDPSGIIDGSYRFLFYESIQPDVWQEEKGWLIQQTELETFFISNMKSYGFQGQEIDDFIEFWIPVLDKSKYYAIYPQTSNQIEEVITLNFSIVPDNILRLFYVIKGYDELANLAISEPEINTEFIREGFNITEWGVIRK